MEQRKYCADLSHQQIRRGKKKLRDESRLQAFKERKSAERAEEFIDKRSLYSAINNFQFEHPKTIFNFDINGLLEENEIFNKDVEKFYSKVISLNLADEDPDLVARICAFLKYGEDEIYDELEEMTLEYTDEIITISDSNPDLALSTCNQKIEDYQEVGLITVKETYTSEVKTTTFDSFIEHLNNLPPKIFTNIDQYLTCSDRLLLKTFGLKRNFKPCCKAMKRYVRIRRGYELIAKRSKERRCCCATIFWMNPEIVKPWLAKQIRRTGKELPVRAHTRLTFFDNVDHNFKTDHKDL